MKYLKLSQSRRKQNTIGIKKRSNSSPKIHAPISGQTKIFAYVLKDDGKEKKKRVLILLDEFIYFSQHLDHDTLQEKNPSERDLKENRL